MTVAAVERHDHVGLLGIDQPDDRGGHVIERRRDEGAGFGLAVHPRVAPREHFDPLDTEQRGGGSQLGLPRLRQTLRRDAAALSGRARLAAGRAGHDRAHAALRGEREQRSASECLVVGMSDDHKHHEFAAGGHSADRNHNRAADVASVSLTERLESLNDT